MASQDGGRFACRATPFSSARRPTAASQAVRAPVLSPEQDPLLRRAMVCPVQTMERLSLGTHENRKPAALTPPLIRTYSKVQPPLH